MVSRHDLIEMRKTLPEKKPAKKKEVKKPVKSKLAE